MTAKVFTENFKVPTDKFASIATCVIQESWKAADSPKGWKVLLNGVWSQKKDSALQLYASNNAAKDRTEMEFGYRFNQAFDAANREAWNTYREGLSAIDFYEARYKAFRKFMNWCYENKVVEYVEVTE